MNGRLPFPSFKSLSRNGNRHIGALHLFRIPEAIALGALEFAGTRQKYAVGLVIVGEIPGRFQGDSRSTAEARARCLGCPQDLPNRPCPTLPCIKQWNPRVAPPIFRREILSYVWDILQFAWSMP